MTDPPIDDSTATATTTPTATTTKLQRQLLKFQVPENEQQQQQCTEASRRSTHRRRRGFTVDYDVVLCGFGAEHTGFGAAPGWQDCSALATRPIITANSMPFDTAA
jgi:hypothetical protein